jgi:membrane protease YdiL (CAAX protease family)
MSRPLPTPVEFFRMALLFEAGLVVAGILLGWLMTPPAWASIEWSVKSGLLGALAALPMLAALLFLRQLRAGSVGRLNRTVNVLLVPLFRGLSFWHFAVISALAGLGEELLFRGIMQELLAEWLGSAAAAIALTSVAFGAAHLITPLYGVLAAAVSVYLGWLFVQYGHNLLVPIMAHAVYDFVALLYLTGRSGESLLSEKLNRQDAETQNGEPGRG